MRLRRLGPLIVALVLAATFPPLRAQAPDDRLEADAATAMRVETTPFAERVVLADRLQAAAGRAGDREQAARLARQWLSALRWTLDAVPFGEAARAPYREWLDAHDTVVVYSEPAGQWLVSPEVAWMVHDTHRSTAAADEIAWFVVMNGYPGECEGYVPCYANILNRLEGEYLRQHPTGRHVTEALERTRVTLEEALRLLSPTPPREFLDRATDCGDLEAGLEPLRTAVIRAANSDSGPLVELVDRLLAFCR